MRKRRIDNRQLQPDGEYGTLTSPNAAATFRKNTSPKLARLSRKFQKDPTALSLLGST